MKKYLILDHPLANNRRLKESRYIYYELNKGKQLKCHWCGKKLVWRVGNKQSKFSNSVCIDHLDRNEENNDINNLVPSCRQCNANRHTYGRRKPIICKICKKEFLPRKKSTKYCSIKCLSISNKGKRGSNAKHGTRSRYMYGCRCKLCVKANSNYWKKWFYKNTNSKYSYVGYHKNN